MSEKQDLKEATLNNTSQDTHLHINACDEASMNHNPAFDVGKKKDRVR